jgi:hypothetical protein
MVDQGFDQCLTSSSCSMPDFNHLLAKRLAVHAVCTPCVVLAWGVGRARHYCGGLGLQLVCLGFPRECCCEHVVLCVCGTSHVGSTCRSRRH